MQLPLKLVNRKNVWSALGIAGLGWEVYSLSSQNGASLTETTKAFCRLDTPQGKWVFLLAYGTVVAWYPAHLFKDYNWDRNPALYQILAENLNKKVKKRA